MQTRRFCVIMSVFRKSIIVLIAILQVTIVLKVKQTKIINLLMFIFDITV